MSTNMERWFTELETTTAGQARGMLHDENEVGDDLYCCLGVGCELAVKDKAITTGDVGYRLYDGQSTLPPLSFATWLGLPPPTNTKSPSFDLYLLDPDGDDLLDREESEITASYMNDECRLSFAQIAQMLRTHDFRVVGHL